MELNVPRLGDRSRGIRLCTLNSTHLPLRGEPGGAGTGVSYHTQPMLSVQSLRQDAYPCAGR